MEKHLMQEVLTKETVMENKKQNPEDLPVLTLAYLGDAVYELQVREHFIKENILKVSELHEKAIPLVSAVGQSNLWDKLEPLLSEKDLNIMKRGRNAKSPHSRPTTAIGDYRRATGVETLIGYWYIQGEQQKLDKLFAVVFKEEEQ